MNYVFASYAKVLMDSMDPIKLPSLKYGVIGGYGYFDLKLKPLAAYDNLRSQLFQILREIVCSAVHYGSCMHVNQPDRRAILWLSFTSCLSPCAKATSGISTSLPSSWESLLMPMVSSSR